MPVAHQRAYGLPNTEPIYITSTYWKKRRPAQVIETEGGHYLTFWYVGQIGADAVSWSMLSLECPYSSAYR